VAETGFVKLWRSLLEAPEWDLPDPQLRVVIALLLLAEWRGDEAGDVDVSELEITCKRSRYGSLSRHQVRRALLALERIGFIYRRAAHEPRTNRARTAQAERSVSLVNWDRYQSESEGAAHEPRTSRARAAQSPYIEEGKKGRREEAPRDPCTPTPTSKRSSTTKPTPEHLLLKAYEEELLRHRGLAVAAPATKANLRAVAPALQGRSEREAARVVRAYVHLDDPFLHDRGWALRFLPDRLSEVVAKLAGGGRSETSGPAPDADMRSLMRSLEARKGGAA